MFTPTLPSGGNNTSVHIFYLTSARKPELKSCFQLLGSSCVYCVYLFYLKTHSVDSIILIIIVENLINKFDLPTTGRHKNPNRNVH